MGDEPAPWLYKTGMITISISAEAYRAITGRSPDPSERNEGGGYALLLDREAIDRLTVARGPGESYSDVIIRLGRGEAIERGLR
jgi:hypothetical protein